MLKYISFVGVCVVGQITLVLLTAVGVGVTLSVRPSCLTDSEYKAKNGNTMDSCKPIFSGVYLRCVIPANFQFSEFYSINHLVSDHSPRTAFISPYHASPLTQRIWIDSLSSKRILPGRRPYTSSIPSRYKCYAEPIDNATSRRNDQEFPRIEDRMLNNVDPQLTGLDFVRNVVEGNSCVPQGNNSPKANQQEPSSMFIGGKNSTGNMHDTLDGTVDNQEPLQSFKEYVRQFLQNRRRHKSKSRTQRQLGNTLVGRVLGESKKRRHRNEAARKSFERAIGHLGRLYTRSRDRGVEASFQGGDSDTSAVSDESSELEQPGPVFRQLSRESRNMMDALKRTAKYASVYTKGIRRIGKRYRGPDLDPKITRIACRRPTSTEPVEFSSGFDSDGDGDVSVASGLYGDSETSSDTDVQPDAVSNYARDAIDSDTSDNEDIPDLVPAKDLYASDALLNAQQDVPVNKGLLQRQAQIVQDIMGLKDSQVGIELVDEDKIRELNRQFLGKNKSTDILSFPFTDDPDILRAYPLLRVLHGRKDYHSERVQLGRIFVCPGFVQRQCDEDRAAAEESIIFGTAVSGKERGVSGIMSELFTVQERLPLLFIHGLLHLLRYDHSEPAGSAEMVEKEEQIASEFSKRSHEYRPSQAGQYVIGVGTDVCHIPRVRRALGMNEDRFLSHVCSPRERRQYQYLKERYLQEISNRRVKRAEWVDFGSKYLAKRFATKEAVAKSLGTGLRHVTDKGIRLQDVEIWSKPSGQPTVQLIGKAREIAQSLGVVDILVAQTDEKDIAVSFATACGSTSDALPLRDDVTTISPFF